MSENFKVRLTRGTESVRLDCKDLKQLNNLLEILDFQDTGFEVNISKVGYATFVFEDLDYVA